MATTAKTKKTASTTKSKGVVASKKKGLSTQQWSIIAIVGVLVLAIGGYLGLQAYQNSRPSASAWGDIGRIQINASTKSYAKFDGYACASPQAAGYNVKVLVAKVSITGTKDSGIYHSKITFNFRAERNKQYISTAVLTIPSGTLQDVNGKNGSFDKSLYGSDSIQLRGWVDGGAIDSTSSVKVSSLPKC